MPPQPPTGMNPLKGYIPLCLLSYQANLDPYFTSQLAAVSLLPVDIGSTISNYACEETYPELFIIIYRPYRPGESFWVIAGRSFSFTVPGRLRTSWAPGSFHHEPRFAMLKIITSFLLLTMVCLAPLAQAKAREAQKAQTISALEAAQMLAQEPKTTFMVDVRTRSQYALLGHPPRAYNVPWKLATGVFQVAGGAHFRGARPPLPATSSPPSRIPTSPGWCNPCSNPPTR